MATAYTDQVQKVYIAYYGRAADPVGLAYWAAKVETDGLDGIMASFGASAEANTLYGSLTNTAKVNALYLQSFGRDADFAGLMYYAGQLTAGTMTAATIAQNIFDGASGTDATILANKLTVAKAYTAAINTADEVVAYSGTVAAASARALLTTVDAATVTASFDVATSVASIVSVAAAVPAVAGSTLALTTKTDSITGGAGADTINGVLQKNGATGTTAAPGDSVLGGADVDTLSISVAGTLTAAYTLAALTTSSVEKVVLSNFETSAFNNIVDTSLMTGITHAGLSASSASGDTQFSNLKNLVEGEMHNGAADVTLTYGTAVVAGTADSQALNVSNTTGGTFTAAGVETVNVKTGLLASTLTAITAANATKITVSGATALTVNTALTQATIDASAMTSAFTVTAGSAVQAITGGSGNDTIDMVATLTSADVIKGGLGTDTLKLAAAGTIDATATTGELIGVSGIETIQMAATADAATLNLTGFSGVTNVNAAANTKTVTITTAPGTTSETISFVLNGVTHTTAAVGINNVAASAAKIQDTIDALSGFTATNSAGVVTITADTNEVVEVGTFSESSSTTSTYTVSAYSDVTLSNLEADTTVNVYSGDSVTATLADASGTADSLAVNLLTKAGDKDFAHTIGAVVVSNVETVTLNSSGMKTGVAKTLSVLTSDATTTTLNITGDSDLVLSDITSLTGATTIDASAFTGDLSLAGAASLAQAITTGSGNDTITMGANVTDTDVIDGGANTDLTSGAAGKDKLTLSGAYGTVVTASTPQISNVETIQYSNSAADVYLNATSITGASNIAFSASSGTTTLTNVAAGQVIGAGIGTVGLVGTLSVTLADETGTADAITLDVPNTVSSNTTTIVKTAAIETVNISASTDSGSTDTTTFTTTNMKAANVVITSGHSGNTVALGTLNAATTNVDGSAYKGILTMAGATGVAMSVSANGAVANNISVSGAATVTLGGKLGTAINTVAGSTGVLDVLNATANLVNTDFSVVTGMDTINLTISNGLSPSVITTGKDDGLNLASTINILGGNSLSGFIIGNGAGGNAVITDKSTNQTIDASTFAGKISIDVAPAGFDAELTIKGGALATDVVNFKSNVATDNKIGSMTGVESLVITSTDAATAAIDLSNAVGLTKVTSTMITNSAAEKLTISKLATGVKVLATSAETADQLVIDLTDKASSDNVLNFEMVAFGATADVFNLDVAGLETLNITNKASTAGVFDLAGVNATSSTGTVSVNIAGAGLSSTLNALNTDINVVDASTATGALVIAAAQRDSDLLTVTGGFGADTIAMENSGDVLNGAAGTDTLTINYSGILGGISVDLSKTDQVISMDGSANAAVQNNFENVDVSNYLAFGSVIKGSSGANSITGTASADNISSGAGLDVIVAGGGNDVIINGAGGGTITGGAGNDTITLGAGSETVVVSGNTAALNGLDTIGTFGAEDTFDLSVMSSGALANAVISTAITTATVAALAAQTTAIAFQDEKLMVVEVANTADVDTVANIVTALTNGGVMDAIDPAANIDSYLLVGGADDDTVQYLYAVNNDGTLALVAGELALVGTITTDKANGIAGYITTDFVYV